MKNIYYLGPAGSYSHIVTKKVFDNQNLTPCTNFADIVKNTLTEKNAIGVLPIENSITSNIHENMDYLFKENLTIIAEAYLKIRIDLIGLKNAEIQDIKKVYSHPKALSQCKEYIRLHNLTIQETASTAAAKNLILEINDKRVAAIGSKELINDKNLQILDEDIGDEKFNITRFVFVSKNENEEFPGIKNKTSIMFAIPHQPGTLAKILTEFAKAEFNLIKIESRPIPATSWEYQFWVDIEDKNKKKINEKSLTDILKKNAQNYKIIGIYPSGKIYD